MQVALPHQSSQLDQSVLEDIHSEPPSQILPQFSAIPKISVVQIPPGGIRGQVSKILNLI